MNKLIMIRHGESTYARSGRYTGTTDVPLTGFGRQQARITGRWLAQHHPPSRILCSPMLRTRQTLEEIKAGAQTTLYEPWGNIPEKEDSRVAEICYGGWEGKTRPAILQEDADRYHAWEKDPVTLPAGGNGETADVVRNRVQAALQSVLSHTPHNVSETLWVITHRTVMRIMLATLLETPLQEYRSRYDQYLASVNLFALNADGKATLLGANITPWLGEV